MLLDELQCCFTLCCESNEELPRFDVDCRTKRSSLLPEQLATGFSSLHLLAVKPAWPFGDGFAHPLSTQPASLEVLGLGAMRRSTPRALAALALDNVVGFLLSATDA